MIMLYRSHILFESNSMKKAKLFFFCYCSTTLFSLLNGPAAFAENPVKKCKPETEQVIAMYLVPVSWKPPSKIAHIMKNKYWGAPNSVKAHMTLTGFALPSNSTTTTNSECKKHNEAMTIGVKNFNNKIKKPYHIGYSNWGKPQLSKGQPQYVKYPLICKSSNCFSLLKSALKLNSKFVGSIESPTSLHVSFDNHSTYSSKYQEAIRKFLGTVKWKACKVSVSVSGHNDPKDPGRGLKKKTC